MQNLSQMSAWGGLWNWSMTLLKNDVFILLLISLSDSPVSKAWMIARVPWSLSSLHLEAVISMAFPDSVLGLRLFIKHSNTSIVSFWILWLNSWLFPWFIFLIHLARIQCKARDMVVNTSNDIETENIKKPSSINGNYCLRVSDFWIVFFKVDAWNPWMIFHKRSSFTENVLKDFVGVDFLPNSWQSYPWRKSCSRFSNEFGINQHVGTDN